jgi:hypothetical protein
MLARLWRQFMRNERGEMLSKIAMTTGAVALVAVLAGQYTATQMRNEREALDRMVAFINGHERGQAAARAGREDPVTTGSLGSRAQSTKLDPCVLR